MIVRDSGASDLIARLTMICGDMLPHCSSDYFPIKDSIVSILIDACLNTIQPRNKEWSEGFKMVKFECNNLDSESVLRLSD